MNPLSDTFLLWVLVLASGCATPNPTDAVPIAPVVAPHRCSRSFQRSGTLATLEEVRAALREPRRLAPRANFAVFVPGSSLVAHVDRQSGELRVVPVRGGTPRALPGVRGAPVHPPGPDGRPRVTHLRRGENAGEIIYRVGVHEYRASTEGTAAPELVQPEEGVAAFKSVLAEHGLQRGEQVIPITSSLAAVVVTDVSRRPKGLYALDAMAGTLRPALPAGLEVVYAPQRVNNRQVLFGASDGRYHLLDLVSLELTCASETMPEGHQPGPFALSSDGTLLAYAARRLEPVGLPDYALGLVNLEAGTERLLLRIDGVSALMITPVPGRPLFVVSPRRKDAATFLSLDDAEGLVRLTTEVLGAGVADVSEDAVVFTRERSVTELVPTPQPPIQNRDSRMGCDPVPRMGGGCGWVSNGCDWVWSGPCVRYLEPPDPADGVYIFPL